MELSESAERVRAFMAERGFFFQVAELPGTTRTAQEAATSIGCSVAQIAKSLVFRETATDRPVLVIASGANRVDVTKIERAAGLQLGKADGKYVKERVGFAIGGIPPVGHKEPLQTFLDEDLCRHATLWAAAGTPFAVFQLASADLAALTGGQWLDLAEKNE